MSLYWKFIQLHEVIALHGFIFKIFYIQFSSHNLSFAPIFTVDTDRPISCWLKILLNVVPILYNFFFFICLVLSVHILKILLIVLSKSYMRFINIKNPSYFPIFDYLHNVTNTFIICNITNLNLRWISNEFIFIYILNSNS